MGGVEVQNFRGHKGCKYLCHGRRKSSIVSIHFDAVPIPHSVNIAQAGTVLHMLIVHFT